VSFSDGSGAGLVTLSEEKSLVDRLTLCLSRLQKRSRRVVRMRFRHEMTQEAIGEALGISKQHAGRVIAQALEGLRRCMESEP
jgi:RNA polymerase sigma factor (sigma-70 family)